MVEKTSDFILRMGEDFMPEAMPDYDQRVESGEFKGKTPEQIRDIYFNEAVEQEEEDEEIENLRRIQELEERENEDVEEDED